MTHTEVAEAFLDGLRGLDDGDVSDDLLDEARRAGRRLVAAGRWARLTGERVDTATLRSLLGISRQALHQRIAAGTVLAVPGVSTTWYPTWQLRRPDGGRVEVRSVVTAVLQEFRSQLGSDVDALTLVSWAATEQPELDGSTPQAWIQAERADDAVVLAAGRAAAALAR